MADSSPSNRSTPKFTRCRTGCLRCRVRRRKCDEKKPKCQNCIDKDLVCQYGLQVSFLEKNTFTVSAQELQRPKDHVAYKKIQFVKEDPLCPADTSTDESPSPVSTPTVDVRLPRDDKRFEQGKDTDTRHGLERHDSDTNGNLIFHTNQELPSPGDIHNGQFQSVAAFSDRDESAVRGLLALGSSNNVIDMPTVSSTTPGLPDFDHTLVLSPLSASTGREDPSPQTFTSIDTTNANSVVSDLPPIGFLSLSESERLELLRHYRYHVAPWLDICDMRQPFGIAALQLSLGSERLLSALMRLSKACMIPESTFLPDIPESLIQIGITDDSTDSALLYVLECVRNLVSDISRAWKRAGYPDSIHSLVQYAYYENIDSALYWITLRLDLAVALATDGSIQLPLPMSPIPSMSLLSRSDDIYEKVRHFSHSILWMTSKALIICHPEDTDQPSHHLMDGWLQVFEEIHQWYHLRPLEFQPMIELEGDDQIFHSEGGLPLLLFANVAGAFSNQLYHTAMLLLLQSKPRTVLLHNAPSRLSSPLWHAQRICGIALNNDRRECWDPCLLASFLVAAKLMTHESQQKEILQGFDRIRVLTGWDVGEYLIRLREDWSFSEGD